MEEASEINKETWNKKRVFLGIFLLALFIIGGGYLFRDKIFINSSRQLRSVEGASTSAADTAANVQETVKEKIDNLKQEVSGLNLVEVASSSPEVQKILSDIKALQQYPANQIKQFCNQVCGYL